MKNFFSVILVLLIFILISSCNDCKDPACPKLTEVEMSWFPYSRYDTLIFHNVSNDSILYFPISNSGSGSNLYTPTNGDECNKYCVAGLTAYSDCYINNEELSTFMFLINRIKDDFFVVISNPGSTIINHSVKYSYFDLRDVKLLEQVQINNVYLKDVYHFTCYPEIENVAETYVKKSIGLVKIVFRNGQEFELVEHIKSE